MNKLNPITITRDESTSIKGLLIVLIVVAHNVLIASLWNNSVFSYLVAFSVYCFYILPFLYPIKALTGKGFMDNFVRFYVPYTWAFIFCLSINHFVVNQPVEFTQTLRAYIVAYRPLIKEATGFSFIWFMPVAFALFVLRGLFYSSKKILQPILILLTIIFLALSIYDYTITYKLASYIPFGFTEALTFLFMCLVSRLVVGKMAQRVNCHKDLIHVRVISLTLFVLFSVGYVYMRLSPLCESFFYLIKPYFYTILPILSISTLYAFKQVLGASKLLLLLGSISYPIYLFHIFIYNAMMIIAAKYNLPMNATTGLAILILTILVCITMTKILQKIKPLYRLMLPNSVNDLVVNNK